MPITLTAIPGGAATSRKPIDDISDDIKSAVEDGWTYNQENPAERLEAAFSSEAEAEEFLKDARAYAYQRPAGRIVISGNATKDKTVPAVDDKGQPIKGQTRTIAYARFRVLAYEGPAEDAVAPAE